MAFVCGNTMNSAGSTSSHTKNAVIDDEDEELAQLRLAALLSRKSTIKKNKEESNNEDSVPQSSFIQTFQTGTSRKFWSNRRRAISTQKPNHRSNLIVINPVALEGSGKGSETEPYPKLVLPQHRWCASSNEDSMSPSSSNFKKKDPSRFSRFESDSDSDSDFDILSSPSENSAAEEEEEVCDKQNPDGEIHEAVSSSFNVPSPTLRESASTVDFVELEVFSNHLNSETEKTFEKVNTSDFHSTYNASESSDDEMCQPDHQKEAFLSERDLQLQESANVVDLTSEMPVDSVLNDLQGEIDSEDNNVCVNKEYLLETASPVEIVSKEPVPPPLETQFSPGVLETKDCDPVIENCEHSDSVLTNGNELCNSELLNMQRPGLNSHNDIGQSLSENDLRHELKKRKQKRGRRNRSDRYSEYTSSSDSDSSSKSSYSDQQSHCSASTDSPSSSDQGSSDESLSPPVKSVLSVVKPISLGSSDLRFRDSSLSQVSKGQKEQKCQKVEYHSSIEDMCSFNPQSSKKRRSSSSSVEKDYKKSTEDHFTDEVPDGWCKKRLPVHMRLGVPAKRFAEGKYSTNDPKKTNFRIEVSNSSFDNDSANNNWRKERSVKDDTHKKRKVTW